jgi:hypothetical protein
MTRRNGRACRVCKSPSRRNPCWWWLNEKRPSFGKPARTPRKFATISICVGATLASLCALPFLLMMTLYYLHRAAAHFGYG